MKNKCGIYVLCHNDENTIQIILNELVNSKLSNEIFVTLVDDYSSDSTLDIIKKSGFRFIANNENLGYGGSIKRVLQDAFDEDFAFFGIFPGDHQRKLSDLLEMLQLAQENNFDVVIGTKVFFKDGNIGPFRRRIGNIFITNLCRVFFNKNIKDPLAGFKVYKTLSAYQIAFNCSSKFGFDIDYLFWSEFNNHKKNYYPAEVSYLSKKSSIKNVQTQGMKFVLRILIYFIAKILFKLIKIKNK